MKCYRCDRCNRVAPKSFIYIIGFVLIGALSVFQNVWAEPEAKIMNTKTGMGFTYLEREQDSWTLHECPLFVFNGEIINQEASFHLGIIKGKDLEGRFPSTTADMIFRYSNVYDEDEKKIS